MAACRISVTDAEGTETRYEYNLLGPTHRDGDLIVCGDSGEFAGIAVLANGSIGGLAVGGRVGGSLAGNALQVIVLVGVGAVLYIGMSKVLGREEFKYLRGKIKNQKRGKSNRRTARRGV